MTKTLHRSLVAIAAGCVAFSVATASAQDPYSQRFVNAGMVAGIHYGVPLKWSLALGYVLPGDYNQWQPLTVAELGIGGWRAGLGAMKTTNELGGGYIVRAGVLHTDTKVWRAPPQATYVGPEFEFMPIFAIGVRVGGFIRVDGKSDRGLLTTDLNLLF